MVAAGGQPSTNMQLGKFQRERCEGELTIDPVLPGIHGRPPLPRGVGTALANPTRARDGLVGADPNRAVGALVRGMQYHDEKSLLLVVYPGLESMLPEEGVVGIVMAISPHEIEGRIYL